MSITNLHPKADELVRPRLHIQVRLADEICDVYEFSWNELQAAMRLAEPVFNALTAGTPLPVAIAQATGSINDVLGLAIGKPASFFEDDRITVEQVTELLAIVFTLNKEQLGKALPALLKSLAATHPAVAALLKTAPSPSVKLQRASSRQARSR